jgi:curli biogenesis system outer membrane secretion channel CsgG
MTSLNRSAVLLAIATLSLGVLAGCATESHQALEVTKPAAAATAASYVGPKSALAVGTFDNRSSYLRGIFSDGVDRPEARPRPS